MNNELDLERASKILSNQFADEINKQLFGKFRKRKITFWNKIRFYLSDKIESFRTWLGEKVAGRMFSDFDY